MQSDLDPKAAWSAPARRLAVVCQRCAIFGIDQATLYRKRKKFGME